MKTEKLSKREREILTLIAKGRTGDEIAKLLKPKIAKRTVDAHVSNALQKTGARNACQLVAFFYQDKLTRLNKKLKSK